MSFCSILYEHGDQIHRYTQPDFFVDLNIDQILKFVQNCFPEQDISRFWNHLPQNRSCSLYRQEIYRDIKKDELHPALEEYLKQIRQSRAFGKRREEASAKPQRQFWHLREIHAYCRGLEDLKNSLDRLRPASSGLRAFHAYLQEYLADSRFLEMKERACTLMEFFETARLVVHIDGNRFQVDSVSFKDDPTSDTPYERFLQDAFLAKDKRIQTPFSGNAELCEFEEAILEDFQNKHRDLFADLARFDRDYENYLDPALDRFNERTVHR